MLQFFFGALCETAPLCGTSVTRTRFDYYEGIVTKVLKALSVSIIEASTMKLNIICVSLTLLDLSSLAMRKEREMWTRKWKMT